MINFKKKQIHLIVMISMILTVFILSCKTRETSSTPQVFGGTIITNDEYPGAIRINFICAGVKISEHHILLAGHCVTRSNTDSNLSTNFRDKGYIRMSRGDALKNIVPYVYGDIIKTYVHPEWNLGTEKFKNGLDWRAFVENYADLAIIKVKGEIPGEITPILKRALTSGESVTFVGGGPTLPNRDDAGILRKIDMEINARSSTDHIWKTYPSSKVLTMPGDSGGGLFVKEGDNKIYVAGILAAKNETRNFSYFTRLDRSEVQKWINDILSLDNQE